MKEVKECAICGAKVERGTRVLLALSWERIGKTGTGYEYVDKKSRSKLLCRECGDSIAREAGIEPAWM